MRYNTRDSKGRFVKAQAALMEQKLYPYPLTSYTDIQEVLTSDSAEEDDNESLLRDFLQAAAVTFILFPLAAILCIAICWIISNC